MPNGHSEDRERLEAAKAGLEELLLKEKAIQEKFNILSDSKTKDELKEVYLQQAKIHFFLFQEAKYLYGTPPGTVSLSNALVALEKALSIDPLYGEAEKLKGIVISHL